MEEIFKRVSVRKYEDKTVEKDKIEMILRAAMAAPSAGNQQLWEFYVVTEKETIKNLSECSPYSGCAVGAPVVLVPFALVPFGYPAEERKQQDRYDESRVHYYQASDC